MNSWNPVSTLAVPTEPAKPIVTVSAPVASIVPSHSSKSLPSAPVIWVILDQVALPLVSELTVVVAGSISMKPT